MNNKPLVAATVGVVIGFIIGFFVAQIVDDTPVPGQVRPEQLSESELPSDHPPPEVLEQLTKLQERAIAHPKDKEVRILLGNSYYDMKRFDAAATWYTEALELDPTNVNVQTDLATAQLYQGQVELAILSYQKSLSLDPNHAQTLQNLGIAHFASGDFNAAIQIWQRLLTNHPEYPHKKQIEKHIDNALENLSKERSQG